MFNTNFDHAPLIWIKKKYMAHSKENGHKNTATPIPS